MVTPYAHFALTPVLCPRCGQLTEALFDDDNGALLVVRCRLCDWRQEPPPPRRPRRDPVTAQALKTVLDHRETEWQPTTHNCPKCGGRVLGRWRPGRKKPTALQCRDCGGKIPTA